MIERYFTCVVCPNGCSIRTKYEESTPPKLLEAEGYRCPKGIDWVKQEIENPMRTFSTSVLVRDGDFIEVSVRITKPVPLSKVFEVMDAIRKLHPSAPLTIGDVLLTNPAGTETEVIVTRNINRAKK